MHDGAQVVGQLSAEEARVLGCLIEKEATTPDNYPLTVNSLRNACNQTTSRDPVVSYTDLDVERALTSLRERSLTRTVHSTSNRATKFRHVAPEALALDPGETALLAVLLLRGPQTLGELKSRTERQYAFGSTDDVAAALAGLADREPALALQLDRRPGQKDARWIQLLATADGIDRDGDVELSTGSVRPAEADDPYGEATAEFYDLLATAHWETFGLQLLDLFAGVDPAAGPILDIGSGTGVGLANLQAAVPGAMIHAIEPSRAMRTALHARLSGDEELRRITTVDPRPFGRSVLPPSVCAVVLSAVIGHLSDGERHQLWRFVAEQIPAGTPVVVEMLPPERPVELPLTRYRSLPVGSFVYEGWQEGTPIDDRQMSWTMTYKVLDGETEIAVYQVQSDWRCYGPADLRAEVAEYGLEVAEYDEYVVVTRSG
jgi:uncharacterized protein YceH (UPF0502 family)/SAM-dependent methyltransferase